MVWMNDWLKIVDRDVLYNNVSIINNEKFDD